MAKQGYTSRADLIFVYQEDTTSNAIGIDNADNDKLKIIAQTTPGALPSGGLTPAVNTAGIVIDPSSGGTITICPEDSGDISLQNVYGTTPGTPAGVLLIDTSGVIGTSATVDPAANTVFAGMGTGNLPDFTDSPSVEEISITTTDGGDPTSGVNVGYLNSVITGLKVLQRVRVATTANLTATYANGAAGVGATLTNSGVQAALVIDGVALQVADRVLVKDQTAEEENGVYDVTDIGSGATNWVLTRSTDFDTPAEITRGTIVPVHEGTVNAGTLWMETEEVTTIGTDPIRFTQLTIAGDPFLLKANNLSDVTSASTSRTNLGLTNVAIQNVTQYNTLVGGAANAITSITTGNNGQVLTSGGASSNPAYAAIGTNAGLTQHGVVFQSSPAFATTSVGIAGQALISGGPGFDPDFGTISLTTGVSGVLPIANGGTNASSMATTDGVVYFDGTRLVTTAVGTAGQVLTSNGAGMAPTFQAAGGGGGGVTLTAYDTPGMFAHNVNASTVMIEVLAWAGGQAGYVTNGGGEGGQGGIAGSCFWYKIPRIYFGASPITVVVGAGGVSSGGGGENSSFGALNTSGTGTFSFGGLVYSNDSNFSQLVQTPGGTDPIVPNATNDRSLSMVPTSGGGGSSTSPLQAAGNGGSKLPTSGVTAILAGGASGGGNGNDGYPGTLNGYMFGGTGGGGGTGATPGGNGGFPGGGGGGGSSAGSAGGSGGNGLVIVIEYA